MTTLEIIVFVLFAIVTLGAGLGLVLVKDIFYDALLLGLAFGSVAVHFVMLQASFVAAMQILVYVGGVLILIAFAVMLVGRSPEET